MTAKTYLKTLWLIVLCAVAIGLACPCVAPAAAKRPFVVATLFPQYDFARQIAGGHANVVLLLPPGVDSHSYEPTPADMIKINRADLFLYTGDSMEHWAARVCSGLDSKQQPMIVDVSQGITLSREGEHTHTDNHAHGVHVHDFDPHIWTDPNNAVKMTENILAGLIAVAPENVAVYRKNAENYIKALQALDADIKKTVAAGTRREIVLGGRNAFHYFFNRYGIDAVSAYDSCSADMEPSVKTVVALTNEIKKEKIPVVYYEELQVPRIAGILAEETGAKMLLLHSCHNVSKEDFDTGVTYLSLMRGNLKNLKAGLQ